MYFASSSARRCFLSSSSSWNSSSFSRVALLSQISMMKKFVFEGLSLMQHVDVFRFVLRSSLFSFFFELLEFEFLFALGFAFFFELEGDLLVQNSHVLLIGLVVLHRFSLFAVELDELVF